MSNYKPIDPILRDPRPRLNKEGLINIVVKAEVQEFFVKLMNHLGKRSDWFASCISCIHWESRHPDVGKCNKFDCVPPPRVIVDGCPEYVDVDEVPF
jgi:hypothetical protein